MLMILMELLKNANDEEFEEFVKHISDEDICTLLIEIKEYMNFFNLEIKNEIYMLKLFKKKSKELLNIKAKAKFKLLNKTLKNKIIHSDELEERVNYIVFKREQ